MQMTIETTGIGHSSTCMQLLEAIAAALSLEISLTSRDYALVGTVDNIVLFCFILQCTHHHLHLFPSMPLVSAECLHMHW
jgi:hypothetical protein